VLRFLASIAIYVIANAIGLIVAAAVLDDMSLTAAAFVTDVAIFTAVEAVAQPFVQKTAMKNSAALVGSSALIASLVALVVTSWLSDGLQISGALTWVLATVIIWAASLIAALLLPALVFKRALQQTRR
jgi:uncharacterized membrane protein YvlD (DUF360 family)